jgi:Lrp/AsnC family leucine-responsive transcriptional regulator
MKKSRIDELNQVDRRILQALQSNGRLSNVELSERVHLSPSQCQRRLKRLEDLGVIRRYVALLDNETLGLSVTAVVSVTLEKYGKDPIAAFHQAINDEPAILECWAVTGDSDYLLRVVATDLQAFSDFLMHRLLGLPMVAGVRSTILMQELKATTALPLL